MYITIILYIFGPVCAVEIEDMVLKEKKIKAVIPVAGVGTKLRPHTFTQPKPLIPVAGKPIISHIIDQFLKVGIDDFVVIIGYLGDKIRQYVIETYPQIKVEFIYQERRLGLGHAIWTASEAFQDADELVIVLGDTIVDLNFDAFLKISGSCVGVSTVKTPSEFGIVEVGSYGFISKAVEKPNVPTSNLAIVGIYKLDNVPNLIAALNGIIEVATETDDELQLTDALMSMIKDGEKISIFHVNKWFDCGKREVLLETNATLLSLIDSPSVDLESFEQAIIIHPVAIGENCTIKNSIIGPNVTIGANSTIVSSVVDNSIIGSFAELKEIVLRKSIVGNDASVKGHYVSLNIGENTEIEFGK